MDYFFTANCNFWHTSAMKFDKTINRENWEKRGVKKRVASIERDNEKVVSSRDMSFVQSQLKRMAKRQQFRP